MGMTKTCSAEGAAPCSLDLAVTVGYKQCIGQQSSLVLCYPTQLLVFSWLWASWLVKDRPVTDSASVCCSKTFSVSWLPFLQNEYLLLKDVALSVFVPASK